jgi:hypothetical protein
MAILDLVLGRPLSSAEDKEERVGPFAGVSVFGLDALSSDGYGPEAALTILIPLGVVALLILILLGVAYLVAAYGITATEPGSSNYRSILSLLAAAVGVPSKQVNPAQKIPKITKGIRVQMLGNAVQNNR